MNSNIMKQGSFLLLALLFGAASVRAADFSGSLQGGYCGGLGIRASGMVSDFATGFPLAVELSVQHVRLDPGNPEKARQIFINDATNGTPEKSGYIWNFRLDFLHKVRLLGLHDAYVYAGVRRSMFTANFKFVGGNEDFDVTSNQWGIGTGGRAAFPISGRVNFVLAAGLDYYFSSALTGHDTSYGPDGEIINGRKNYTFNDAKAAVNQPGFQLSGMLGLSYRF